MRGKYALHSDSSITTAGRILMEAVKTTRLLSNIDREILKAILSPNGKYSSSGLLSKKLGVPKTTIQRRCSRLEKEFLELSYSLNLERFGFPQLSHFPS